VKNKQKKALDFIVDRLTNSIQNTISGDSFETEVLRFTINDLKQTLKKNGWNFNWKTEINNDYNEVYKLTIKNNPNIIQGVVSLRAEVGYLELNLLESAPFNIGGTKLYDGVPGNLVAFACRLSFQLGFEGYVAFTAKTNLVKHYEKSLGAKNFGGQRMYLETKEARYLVEKYFKTS
jgi:hypothetical protein